MVFEAQFGSLCMPWPKINKNEINNRKSNKMRTSTPGPELQQRQPKNKQSHLGGREVALIRRIPLTFRWGFLHSGVKPSPHPHPHPLPRAAKIEHLTGGRAVRWKKWKNWWVASAGPALASPWQMPGAIRLNRWSGGGGGGGGRRVHDEYSNLVGHYCLTLYFFFSFFRSAALRHPALCAREGGGSRQPLKVIASYCSGARKWCKLPEPPEETETATRAQGCCDCNSQPPINKTQCEYGRFS